MYYTLREKTSDLRMSQSVEDNRIEDDPLLKDERRKLAVLKMGLLIYKFMQRLDPLVYVWGRLRYIVLW